MMTKTRPVYCWTFRRWQIIFHVGFFQRRSPFHSGLGCCVNYWWGKKGRKKMRGKNYVQPRKLFWIIIDILTQSHFHEFGSVRLIFFCHCALSCILSPWRSIALYLHNSNNFHTHTHPNTPTQSLIIRMYTYTSAHILFSSFIVFNTYTPK